MRDRRLRTAIVLVAGLALGACGTGGAGRPEPAPAAVASGVRPQGGRVVAPCRTAILADAAGVPAGQHVGLRSACVDGWALLARTRPAPAATWLLSRRDGHWAVRSRGPGLDDAPALVGVRLGVLERLGADLGGAGGPEIAAAGIIDRGSVPPLDESQGSSSAVVAGDGADWMALARPDLHAGEVGPTATAEVYRWSGRRWLLQFRARFVTGELDGPGSITTSALTGARTPDFLLHGNGADTDYLSVMSAIGGRWHLVPFETGYRPATDVDFAGRISQGSVETALDGCGCAAGPTTYQWEQYHGGAFRPVPPPGRRPACSAARFTALLADDVADPVVIDRAACADGWALAVGRGLGYAQATVGLWEQVGARWDLETLDDGAALGLDPGRLDLPAVLLARLGAPLGTPVAAAVASTPIAERIRRCSPGGGVVSGVITDAGADWLLTACPRGATPAIVTTIYRWTGASWRPQVALELPDRGAIVGLTGWYAAVPSGDAAAFRISGVEPSWTAVVTDTDGFWHRRS